ncbi:hypothetical protein HBI55_140910 [Parastagonospora nodorum]|nr:hypothetical protein HBI49_094870 [Parastagonospora nodorum]KAH5472811.1 hypothetical protein HBI28_130410 [Parastagonospora nodorum]KAH5675722.1 hypothetical protein HBI21_118800 [Parastagonospora nodorum]KAH6257929.1 hypothetical protein HBI42_105330 [Parastagonospora nodorum]KAH6491809.1 hypothetical protein HBI55_140910 [Parastagonospora nodorum]
MSKMYSWASFDISQEMLRGIFAHHNVTPEFLPVVFSFRRHTNRLEEAFSDSIWVSDSKGCTELNYLLKYAEIRNSSEAKVDWSVRQIGVYHRYDQHTAQSTWILIFPTTESSAQRNLMQEANLALTIDFDSSMPFQGVNKDISRLHYIETRLATLPSILAAQQGLIDKLDALNEQLHQRNQASEETCSETRDILGNLRRRLGSYEANVAFVLGKVRSTTQLVSDTISLKSQHTTENVSDQMLILNRSASEDSTSMRVITLVTLVYLPSTFVATFFGMGFFGSGDDAGVHWTSSPLVGLFFALAIPLTLLTLGYWKWSLSRAVRSRLNSKLAGSSA